MTGPTGAVGLVGLGHMGAPMARRLAAAGRRVVATSRSAATRETFAAGGPAAGGPVLLETPAAVSAALAAAGEGDLVVVVSVPAGPDVQEVVAGPAGLLAGVPPGRRLVVVDTSTCDPAEARALAEQLAAAGHLAVDAPVSGGPAPALAGTLSVMAGGSPEALAAAGPVLHVIGGLVVHCGGPGAGQVVKAANQLVVACTVEAVAEALTLAAAQGVDPASTREALLGGYASSRVLDVAGDRMVRGDATTVGSVGLLAKDVGIVQRLARSSGVPVPALHAVAEQVLALAAVDPTADHSTLIRLLRPGGTR